MDSSVVSEGSISDQFHDCNSQPTSPRSKPLEDQLVSENGDMTQQVSEKSDPAASRSREPTPVISAGDSSKENSPRPEMTEVVTTGKENPAVDKKIKRREDRNMEYVLKALSALSTPEEKLAALCKKYTDLLDENRHHVSVGKSVTKKLNQVSRERDSLQTENSKLILAKSKLESLCRELQRHNKVVKDESLARQREEEERRKEVSGRFQTTITDIQSQMEAHSKRNDKLQEDNKELSGKLQTLLEQYEKREEHIQKLLHQKDLETQLLEAKLSQCQVMMEKEQEKGAAEKQMLLQKLIESKTTQEAMAQTEVHLKTQLQIYTQKYAEFETTLNKSNQVFASFKNEMDQMSKKIKKLEKESMMYKQRWENTNRALLEMVEQKTHHEKLIETQTRKNKQLESLCRALQNRTAGEGNTVTTSKENGVKIEAKVTHGSSTESADSSESMQHADGCELDNPIAAPSTSVRPQTIGQGSDEQQTSSDECAADPGPPHLEPSMSSEAAEAETPNSQVGEESEQNKGTNQDSAESQSSNQIADDNSTVESAPNAQD